ncbi:MAG: hypothetical protein KIT84_15135 [Labilithrix sp.]|nr:hypothetical protein [Labilithrix sp.]MCW5812358.1 hypothetical protein [Labilithrix sp.]
MSDASIVEDASARVRGLDRSFGDAGLVVTKLGPGDADVRAMVVQPDRRILVVGDAVGPRGLRVALVRYEPDGALDESFGDRGVVRTAFGASAEGLAVALQDDGKIVVAGASHGAPTGTDVFVARYTAGGDLDPSFGPSGDGRVFTSFGGPVDRAHAVVVQPDGKIVVAGSSFADATGLDFALARYRADGALDDGFGVDGKVMTDVVGGAGRDAIYGMALHSVDGELRIVVVGTDGGPVVARYLPDGRVDESFGDAGFVRGLFDAASGAFNAVAVAADGALVVTGHAQGDVAAARIDARGAPDPRFGEGGTKRVAIRAAEEAEEGMGTGLGLLADGRVVVGGFARAGEGARRQFALLCLDAAGALDPTFGAGGIVLTPMAGSAHGLARALALQPAATPGETRVVLAGSALADSSAFALARYEP